MEEFAITFNGETHRIFKEAEDKVLAEYLFLEAFELAVINQCSLEEQLAENAYVRQWHIRDKSFEEDGDIPGLVYLKDYLTFWNYLKGEELHIIIDESIYHSSMARALRNLNEIKKEGQRASVDLAKFFENLEESYKTIWM